MKLYLDTNIVWGWFRNIMENIRKKKDFKIPSILQFLSNQNFHLFTSLITKIEIVRYLMSEWDCNKKESEEYWDTFINSFKITFLDVKDLDFSELLDLVSTIPTKKKTLVNLIHLQLAKKNNLIFLTGEEKLKKKYKVYYDNILTYKDLRKRFS